MITNTSIESICDSEIETIIKETSEAKQQSPTKFEQLIKRYNLINRSQMRTQNSNFLDIYARRLEDNIKLNPELSSNPIILERQKSYRWRADVMLVCETGYNWVSR